MHYTIENIVNVEKCFYIDLENPQSININFDDGGTISIHPDYEGALHDFFSNLVKEWVDAGNGFDTVSYASAEEIAEGEALSE